MKEIKTKFLFFSSCSWNSQNILWLGNMTHKSTYMYKFPEYHHTREANYHSILFVHHRKSNLLWKVIFIFEKKNFIINVQKCSS